MKETRLPRLRGLQRGSVVTIALLLLASVLACQLSQVQPTAETASDAPTPVPAASTPPPEEPVQLAASAGIIVDNADPGFTVEAGDWGTCQDGDCSGACHGADFRFADPGCTSCRARFDFDVTTAGEYDVWTWWPWGEDRATDTPFTITYSGDPLTVNVDQRNNGDAWYWLATLAFGAGEQASIVVEGSASGYANADAIALTPVGSGPPPAPPAAGAPAIQYFYSEEASTEGCRYLHWDVSEATAVYLNDEAVDNPGSTEVCPEGPTGYKLRAESAEGSVEQALTIDVGVAAATPAPQEPIVPPEGAVLGEGDGFHRVVFLHHSCGANLIEQGSVREPLTAMGYEFYDHGYNEEGLRLADGSYTGTNFDVPGDNTDPDGFAAIFAQPLHDPPDNTFSHLMQYDVIAFKSCFPVSNIGSADQLAEYKSYYLSIRDRADQYPTKIFVIVTQPPQVPGSSDPSEAARARAFSNWLQSDEYLDDHPNIFTFDFFGLLAGDDNFLRPEYRFDDYDAHPNEVANRTIGPLFAEFIDRAVRTYTAQ